MLRGGNRLFTFKVYLSMLGKTVEKIWGEIVELQIYHFQSGTKCILDHAEVYRLSGCAQLA